MLHPALDAFIPGRFLRAAGYEEVSQAAPLLASAAVGGAGTTKSVVLPGGASAANDFYNGLPVILSDQGAGVRGISMVQDYDGASTTATLMEEFAAAPAANVEIPAFLGYRLVASQPDIYLSFDFWHDKKRYKCYNMTISGLTFNFPTSNRGDTAIPFLSISLTGDIDESDDEVDETVPTVPNLGGIAPFRDGDAWLDQKDVCGSNFTADMGIRVGFPPCPNKPNGNEAPQVVETRRTMAMTLNEVLLTKMDFNAMANAQANHPFWLQFGNVSGKVVSFGVPEGRLNFSAPDASGDFVTRAPDLFIDGAERAMNLMFPYF